MSYNPSARSFTFGEGQEISEQDVHLTIPPAEEIFGWRFMEMINELRAELSNSPFAWRNRDYILSCFRAAPTQSMWSWDEDLCLHYLNLCLGTRPGGMSIARTNDVFFEKHPKTYPLPKLPT